MKLNFRLIAKIGFLLVIFGFFMPIACDQNGFQIADYLREDEGETFYALLMYLLVISALIGVIIGVLLCKRQFYPPHENHERGLYNLKFPVFSFG
jgi:hypothetical protein